MSASASQATETPTAAELDRRYRDLFDARSVIGALAVLGVLCFFGFGLSAIDEAVKRSSGFDTGTAYKVSDTVSFTPVAGWIVDPAGTIPGGVVTATKNGVTMKVESLDLQPGETTESFAKVFVDSAKQSGRYAKVSDPETFVATSGQHGVTWSAHGPQDAAESWLVASGTNLAWMPVSGPAASWASVEAELEEMAKSIVVTEPAGGSAP